MNFLRTEAAPFVFLFLAACGTIKPTDDVPVAAPAYYGAGSRLKPISYTDGHGVDVRGSGVMGSWMDTGLNVECDFRPADDGATRCVPTESGLVAYLDAACQVAVGFTRSDLCATDPKFVTEHLRPSCTSGGFREYRVTGAAATPTALFERAGDAGCQPLVILASDGPRFFEVEPIALTELVAGSRKKSEGVPGLAADVWQGEDGSWEIVGFIDETRNEPCSPLHLDEDLARRCVPESGGSAEAGTYFADVTCQTPAIFSNTACGKAPPHVAVKVASSSEGCATETSHEVYPLNDTGVLGGFWLNGDRCSAAPPAPDPITVQTIGAKLGAASFPALEFAAFGSGRLKAAFIGSAGKPFMPGEYYPVEATSGFSRGPLFDTGAGEGCSVFPFPDGTYRCVPLGWDIVGASNFLYALPDCTGNRILDHTPAHPSCVAHPEPTGVVIADGQNFCRPTSVELAPVTRLASSAASVYAGTAGSCAPTAVDPTHVLYLVGAPLASADVFAEIKREVKN